MTDRFEHICAQSAEMRVLQYILGPDKVLEWIHTLGVCGDEKLRSIVPPIPPQELRSITAAADLPVFLWTGLVDMERVMTLYRDLAGPDGTDDPAILDFGCGCGRMLRFLNNYPLPGSVHACEVNAEHVRWCQVNLASVKTLKCDALPPLPYKERTFNLVYSLSVFTHLSESAAGNWISEMRRILAPGGILIATTHGPTALEVIRDSDAHQKMFKLERQYVVDTIKDFKERQFVFSQYDRDTLAAAKAGQDYGNAFIHPDYIYNIWATEDFKLLQYLPGGLRGWQDIAVLQNIAA